MPFFSDFPQIGANQTVQLDWQDSHQDSWLTEFAAEADGQFGIRHQCTESEEFLAVYII